MNLERNVPNMTADFTDLVAEMVADQVPRVFAVVLGYGDQDGAELIAWGMAFDDGAYMTTVDGRNQYSLANAENALNYLGCGPDATAHLVWADAPNGAGPTLGSGLSAAEEDHQ